MSAPDRETVRAAMVPLFDRTDEQHRLIRERRLDDAAILRANAHDVAAKLREMARQTASIAYSPSDDLEAIADQLDPQNLPKIQ